ncbi:MAG: ATP-binding protein [Cyanobacteria bacterium P01_D01_bin.105]
MAIAKYFDLTASVKVPSISRWESLSFTSTLYLRPILDALLETTPASLRDELRLGLQEALVNAAKHGNQLDPKKLVSVRYAKANGYYWWVVSDQGEGFKRPDNCECPGVDSLPDNSRVSDCGRGLYILHQVFDQVGWSENGREIHLAKQLYRKPIAALISPAAFFRMIESWWRRWIPTSAHSA